MRILTTTLALTFSLTVALASETNPVDIRISLVALPKSEPVAVTYRLPDLNVGAAGTTDEMNVGWRIEAGVVGRLKEITEHFSLVGGGWVFYGNQKASTFEPDEREIPGQTGPMDVTTAGVDLYLALSLRMNSYFDLELGPFVGLGAATISDVAVGVDGPDSRVRETGHGDYEEAGVSLAIFTHSLDRSLIFGLGLRYLASYAEGDLSFNLKDTTTGTEYPGGLKEHVEIRQHGFAPYLTFGASF